jgi:hypothetical protein
VTSLGSSDSHPRSPRGAGDRDIEPGWAEIDGDLTAWAARLSTDDAARARSRAHWLSRQAEEEGTFAGVLADLAERGRPVVVGLHNGRMQRGAITVVGGDFIVVNTAAGRDVMLQLAGIASVRTPPGETRTVGDRLVTSDATMAEALSALGTGRTRVLVVGVDATHSISGELLAAGRDLLTIRLDGDGGNAYLTLASVAEVSLAESG